MACPRRLEPAAKIGRTSLCHDHIDGINRIIGLANLGHDLVGEIAPYSYMIKLI